MSDSILITGGAGFLGSHLAQALADRGVEYIEVRLLDVNPFSPVGITAEQIRFLDTLLVWMALCPSEPVTADDMTRYLQNLEQVVTHGRQPGLTLAGDKGERSLQGWAGEIIDDLDKVARLLDAAHESTHFSEAVASQARGVADPEHTLSARLLNTLKERQIGVGTLSVELAEQYQAQLRQQGYRYWDVDYFETVRRQSLQQQLQIEAGDRGSFDQFLDEYFKR